MFTCLVAWEIFEQAVKKDFDEDRRSSTWCRPTPRLGVRPYGSKPGGPPVPPGKVREEKMGKVTRHAEGRTEVERAKVRRTLGPLRQLTVQPRTRARYEAARTKFYQFLQDENLQLPRKREALDILLAEYIEHLWLAGKGRALASDTVAGL